MSPRAVAAVWARHVREIFREKRTLLGLVVVPVVAGVVLVGSREELVQQIGSESDVRHEVAIAGSEHAPDLVDRLAQGPFVLKPVPDARGLVREGGTPVGVEIPEGFERDVRRGEHTDIRILVGRRTLRAQFAQAALARTIEAYALEVLRERLRDEGLPEGLARPVAINAIDVASAEERTRSLLGDFLPFMLMIQIVAGMTPIAVDVTAGEKERRTMEALLATPMTRREILAGKWLLTASFGTAGGTLTVASVVVTLRVLSGGGEVAIPWDGVGLALLGAVLVALLVSIVQIAIGVVARSTQQAGVLMAPILFLAIVPAGFLLFDQRITPGGDLRFAIPGLGPMVLIRTGLIGEDTLSGLAVAVGSTIVYGLIGLRICDRLFRSERALSRIG